MEEGEGREGEGREEEGREGEGREGGGRERGRGKGGRGKGGRGKGGRGKGGWRGGREVKKGGISYNSNGCKCNYDRRMHMRVSALELLHLHGW